jgi:hypothetical protein
VPTFSFSEKQTRELNCGAFGLTAIGSAFGLLPPTKNVELSHRGRIATLHLDLTLIEVAEAIYRITGDLMFTGGYASEGEYYSSASAISYVAQQLGLTVTLNASEEIIIYFKDEFPGEIESCAAITNQMDIRKEIYNLPTPNECQLVVVMNRDSSYHWIAVGSNGSLYDSATGKIHHDWCELTDIYERLTIWLSFSLNQVSHAIVG